MDHSCSLEEILLPDAWLTIGSFDGVHRGHQEIIKLLVQGAHERGLPAVVLTFYPHPAIVLGKRSGPYYLTSPQERAELLGKLGVDYVITLPFNLQLAAMSAEEFVRFVHEKVAFSNLWIGPDFALGRGREGNLSRLQELGSIFHYKVHPMQPVAGASGIISSSLIRGALREGRVEDAAQALGRYYSIAGEVVHGDGRGRGLGIPTANIQVWPERILPKPGVYVCQVNVDGQAIGAVTNVGYRPTFENQPATPRVEAHLLDFASDLYGKKLELSFLAHVRDEKRFDNISALLHQIQQDITFARETLLLTPPGAGPLESV